MFAAGSRGDIQPCLALGLGLRGAGYEVRLAVPADFGDFVRGQGLECFPLRGDVQAIMAGETGREFMEKGGSNPIASIRAIRRMIAPVIMAMAEDALESCRGADLLICLGVFGAFGQAIAEALGLPLLLIEPTPLLPTREFPAASWPVQRNLGGLHNRLSGIAMLGVVWTWYRPFVKEFRSHLGLPKTSFAGFRRTLAATPMLGAYSPALIPPPADWPAGHETTGYCFLDPPPGWRPPAELEAFLEAGDPPVYIGFGSMAGREPERLAALALEALALSGLRGILARGWGGLSPGSLPEGVFLLESAPHGWLFPRMAAVAHHGGAGTTAEGLRAGVPSVILPFILDQAFWGARVAALGAGPAPIPRKRLSAEKLAEALKLAVSDARMRRSAADCGRAIRAEDGVARAVEAVRRRFGPPRAAGQEGRP
jgi:UDP:flavonoid glycosyltransferase YjiC (YdhE family)